MSGRQNYSEGRNNLIKGVEAQCWKTPEPKRLSHFIPCSGACEETGHRMLARRSVKAAFLFHSLFIAFTYFYGFAMHVSSEM